MSFVHSLRLPCKDMVSLREVRESVVLKETPTIGFDEDDHMCATTTTGFSGIWTSVIQIRSDLGTETLWGASGGEGTMLVKKRQIIAGEEGDDRGGGGVGA